ncbi:hypothetical protein [Mesorhizobium sp. CN2-181]|uniref:hypothetical protein n=1 Tax=Mesorhizobium yinganensis TaxID=3157707 RepID=UPI0032B72F4A
MSSGLAKLPVTVQVVGVSFDIGLLSTCEDGNGGNLDDNAIVDERSRLDHRCCRSDVAEDGAVRSATASIFDAQRID